MEEEKREKFKNFESSGIVMVVLSQKVFDFGTNLPKKVPNHHLFFMWIVLRIVIWHLFWEIGSKVKHFLRLSHFYIHTANSNL
jgi:hypothetical protein